MRVAPLVSCQDDLSSSLLSHQDHGYLLEATATLIVFSDIEASVKVLQIFWKGRQSCIQAQYMTELASTIGNRFKKQLEWMGDMESRGQLDGKAKHFLEESLPANVSYTMWVYKSHYLPMYHTPCQYIARVAPKNRTKNSGRIVKKFY